MVINILAGGPLQFVPDLTGYDGIWVGVDRGTLILLQQEISVEMAFGDFDSINLEELNFVRSRTKALNVYPSEKDETDMELALKWAIGRSPSFIRIFGATGGRLDHFFANTQLLLMPSLVKSGIQTEIIDKQNRISVIYSGLHTVQRDKLSRYISFIPIHGCVEQLSLQGFKYPLVNQDVPHYSTRCISNELLCDTGTISFTKGILMVIRSHDELPE